jgi:hypothetical protein
LATSVAIVLVFAASASATPPHAPGEEPCSWGASSTQVEVVDGKVVVVSGPDTTGCIPQSKP